jgi:ribosomal protein S18 acetylase RimI-like enzyme
LNTNRDTAVPAIVELTVRDAHIATQLYSLMQAAYKIEAELLQDANFPPLRRTVQKISSSGSRFFGVSDNGILHAAIELVVLREEVYIDALVVAPAQFRKGLGTALLRHVLGLYPRKTFIVQTGKANIPALKLYHKSGFVTEAATTTPTGLQLISLVKVPVIKPASI